MENSSQILDKVFSTNKEFIVKNNMLITLVAIATFATSAAYAGDGNDHQQPPPQPVSGGQQQQDQTAAAKAAADATAKAAADANVQTKVNTNVGVTIGSTSVRTGDSTSSAKGGAGGAGGTGGTGTGTSTSTSTATGTGGTATGTGGNSSLANSGNGGGGTGTASMGPVSTSADNNGAKVSTVNDTRVLYVNLPTMPSVAPTMTGNGSIAVSSQCGPLKEKFQKPIQYLLVGHFGVKTITLDGQVTDVLQPVIDENNKAKLFDVVDNGDGTVSEWGTIYTEAAIVVSSSVSKQFGLGLIGSSAGGNAANGVAGTITGTQRIIALGRCEYRKYKVVSAATVAPAVSIGLNAPKTDVLALTGRQVLVKESTRSPLCAGKPIPEGYKCAFVRDSVSVVKDVNVKK